MQNSLLEVHKKFKKQNVHRNLGPVLFIYIPSLTMKNIQFAVLSFEYLGNNGPSFTYWIYLKDRCGCLKDGITLLSSLLHSIVLSFCRHIRELHPIHSITQLLLLARLLNSRESGNDFAPCNILLKYALVYV